LLLFVCHMISVLKIHLLRSSLHTCPLWSP
jgi:hypothetical protein